jgi:IclR family transcriptional regulator, mhp operon transcriptional activator
MERIYKPVRALERGLDLLLALNRLGRARPGVLARETGIDRTTTYRMLETLDAKGMVIRSETDDSYILSSGVKRLSDGFTVNDRLLRVVAPELGKLLAKVQWPSDFATFSQGSMVIEETTHPFSPFSVHRGMIGRSRPIMRSALGRAMLAGASPEKRSVMLEIVGASQVEDAWEAGHAPTVEKLLEEYNKRGFAWSVGGTESHISAIALPLIVHSEAVGAVNILFFRSAMTIEQCAERFLETFRASVAAMQVRIESDAEVKFNP